MNHAEPLAEANRAVASIAVVAGVVAFASVVAAERSFVALGLQLLAVEFMGGKLAVPWTSAYRPVASSRDVADYIGRGMALGLAVALASGVLSILTGAKVELERVLGWGAVMALVELVLASARDEILLRGMLRRGFGALVPRPIFSAFAAFAAAAWMFGLGESHVTVLVREAALALVAVELWRLDDGAFSAIGFQVAFRFFEASFGGARAPGAVLFLEAVALGGLAVALATRAEPADIVEARDYAARGRPMLH
jgi:hypothetical protein